MKKSLILIFLFMMPFYSFGQIKNAKDFIRFSQKNDSLKKIELNSKEWNSGIGETIEIGNYGIEIYSFHYKNFEDKTYKIRLRKSTNQLSRNFTKTTIELPNKEEFDHWIKEIQDLGYSFTKTKEHQKFMLNNDNSKFIVANLKNINSNLSNCSYEFFFIEY